MVAVPPSPYPQRGEANQLRAGASSEPTAAQVEWLRLSGTPRGVRGAPCCQQLLWRQLAGDESARHLTQPQPVLAAVLPECDERLVHVEVSRLGQ